MRRISPSAQRVSKRCGRRWRPTGRTGSSGSPAFPSNTCGRRSGPWRQAPSAMILTARGAEQHSNGTDTAQAFINLALALGLPGKHASGYGTITGQGNGQGGREHGQKADQLPGYRRLDDPAARAHVAKVWGIDPKELPRAGQVGLRDARPDGQRRGSARPAGARLQSGGLRPGRQPGPQPAGRSGSAGGLRHLPVRDGGAGRCGAADRAVGGRRRHHDQPRGPGDPPEDGAAAAGRGAGRPADARTGSPADLAGHSTSRTIRGLSSTNCGWPAPAASPTTRGSATSASSKRRGCSGPVPDVDHPGTPRMFQDRFATPDGRAKFIRVLHRAPAEVPDAGYPYRAHHRPVDDPIPERHADQAAQGRDGARPARADASRSGPEGRDRGQRHGGAADPARRRRLPRAAQRGHPARSAVRALPLGRRVECQFADRPGAGPVVQDAGVQGLRCGDEPGRRAGRLDLLTTMPEQPAVQPFSINTSGTARYRRPHLPIPPANQRGLPHAHQEPLPAGHLPVHRGRHRQAGAVGRGAELCGAGRLGGPGAVLPRRQHL